MKWTSFTILYIVAALIGCGGGNGSGEYLPEDYVEITSVEPSPVTEGEEVAITVDFNFSLSSMNDGIILVGINNDTTDPNTYVVHEKVVIAEPMMGSETITITTTGACQ